MDMNVLLSLKFKAYSKCKQNNTSRFKLGKVKKILLCLYSKARKSSESGTVRMKRSLLVQAGQALSPEAFHLVLESESETKGGESSL